MYDQAEPTKVECLKNTCILLLHVHCYLYSGGYITVTCALLFVFRRLYYCYTCTVICIQVVILLLHVHCYLYSGGYITVTCALLFVFRWSYYCYMCTVICNQVVVPLLQFCLGGKPSDKQLCMTPSKWFLLHL